MTIILTPVALNAPGHGRRKEDGSYEPEKIYPGFPGSAVLIEDEDGSYPIAELMLFGVAPALRTGKLLSSMGTYFIIDQTIEQALIPMLDEYDEGVAEYSELMNKIEMPDGTFMEVEIGGTYTWEGITFTIEDTGEVDSDGYPIVEAVVLNNDAEANNPPKPPTWETGDFNFAPMVVALLIIYFINKRGALA